MKPPAPISRVANWWHDYRAAQRARPRVYYKVSRRGLLLIVLPMLLAIALLVGAVVLQRMDLADRHRARIADQERTDGEINGLACIFVSQINENAPKFPRDQRRKVKQFRAFYRCPPYSKERAANPFPRVPPPPTEIGSTPPHPGAARRPAPALATVTPPPSSASLAPTPTPPATPSRTTTTATATRTTTVEPSTPPPRPPPPPLLPSPICTLPVVRGVPIIC